MPGCKFLVLTRLAAAPSSMKTNSGSNRFDGYDDDEGGWETYKVYYYVSLSFGSTSWVSIAFIGHILLGPVRDLSHWSRILQVSRRIVSSVVILAFPTFLDFVDCRIFTIVAPLGVPFALCCYSYYQFVTPTIRIISQGTEFSLNHSCKLYQLRSFRWFPHSFFEFRRVLNSEKSA